MFDPQKPQHDCELGNTLASSRTLNFLESFFSLFLGGGGEGLSLVCGFLGVGYFRTRGWVGFC